MSGHTAAYARAAVAWAVARVGEPYTPWRCLAFVEDAYERANGIEVFGGASATESAAHYGTQLFDPEAPPPPGAFVFHRASGPAGGVHRDWGHVGMALGDGRVVHALGRIRVDDARAVQTLTLGPGWSAPELIGWTGPDRILAGHRARDWSTALSDA